MVYTDTGGSGRVILLVHAGLWSLLWGGLIGELVGRGYRCVTLDPPGSGLSDRVPNDEQHLSMVAAAVGAVIDDLDLYDITLVVHDLGGPAGLAAVVDRADRVRAVAAVATFAWRPRGLALRLALRLFGSVGMQEVDAATGWLPRASATRFGVGRHLDRTARRAWRAGLADRPARRYPHRLFRDAAGNSDVHAAAERALVALADRPLLTVFGRFGDYFGFQRQWRELRPDAAQRVVPRGFHFPMSDNPTFVADAIDGWLRSSES